MELRGLRDEDSCNGSTTLLLSLVDVLFAIETGFETTVLLTFYKFYRVIYADDSA